MHFRFGKFAKAMGPIIAVALAAGASGCDKMNVTIDGDEGKALSELDLSGPAPTHLVLLGPDEVRLTEGDKLAITVEGDAEAKDNLRFTLKDGSLGILRKDKLFSSGGHKAVVMVTMPAPEELTMAGSGRILVGKLASKAEVTIAGSGTIEATGIAAERLDVTIAGSGDFRGAGSAGKLKLDVIGSGNAALDALKTDDADVTIAGSGDTAFMSDGKVKASIVGSGEVRVKGRAHCEVSAMGSGKLVCETAPVHNDAPETPDAPEAPGAPKAP